MRERSGDAGISVDLFQLPWIHFLVGDVLAGGSANRASKLGEGEWLIAAQLVDPAVLVLLGKQHGRSGIRIVCTGGSADLAIAGGTEHRAAVEVAHQLVGVVLDVPSIAQQHVVDAGSGQQPFGGDVLVGELHAAGQGVGN
ncbi:hypothetical protein D3C74_206200 [compost metagenome]